MKKLEKNNKKAAKDVERLQKKFTDEEEKIKTLEGNINKIKPLDDLREQEADLERQNEEDKRERRCL